MKVQASLPPRQLKRKIHRLLLLFLCYLQTLYTTSAPQTLTVSAATFKRQRWGLMSVNVTAGDWARLRVPAKEPVVDLQQPLIMSGDVIFTGVVEGSDTAPTLRCDPRTNTSAALLIR